MKKFIQKNLWQLIALIIFAVVLVNINLNTPRTNSPLLVTQYGILFLLLIYLLKQPLKWQYLLGFGVVTRFCLLWGYPELSNDFYRFIWDGELLLKNINPYAFKPNELISQSTFLIDAYYRELYYGMGELSASNYSCYPVVNQLFFLIGSLFSDNVAVNLIVLKLIIILADIGSFFIGKKILELLKIPVNRIGWYFINPFILLEFTGNLHFEGVMIFFLLLCFYMILKEKWFIGAICLGLAIHVKLIPLMFIPFFYKRLKFKASLGFTALTLAVVILIGQILINPSNIGNFMSSIQLYFDNFQFNASIFNWTNSLYSEHIGWNTTQIVGPILAKIAIVLIILLGVLKAYHKSNDFIVGILFSLVIYYSFATTVHPWYISLVLICSVFTKYNFGILWSGIIIVSYLAYAQDDFSENVLLNSMGYILLYGFMIFEIKKYWHKDAIGLQITSFFKSDSSTKV